MSAASPPDANRKRKLTDFSSPVKAVRTTHAWVSKGGSAVMFFVELGGDARAK
jgi:hypothetical protein